MQKILSLFICFCFISILPSYAMAESIQVKSGLIIPLVTTEYKTSKNIVAGEKIKAVIENDVKINDVVVFKKGNSAVIFVSDTKKSNFAGTAGEILLTNGKIIDANGAEHRIEYLSKIQGSEKTYPKVLLGAGLFIWPLLLFGFVKGGEAKLPQQTPIEVTLNEDFKF